MTVLLMYYTAYLTTILCRCYEIWEP